MTERRKFVRIPENSKISYKVLPNMKKEGSITKDISQGGVRFLVHDFVPKGSLLDIEVALGEVYLSFRCIVKFIWIKKEANSEKYEIGVEFIDLPKKSIERLIGYIKGGCDNK